MTDQQAIGVLLQVTERAFAAGLMKNLNDVTNASNAVIVLSKHVQPQQEASTQPNDGESKEPVVKKLQETPKVQGTNKTPARKPRR